MCVISTHIRSPLTLENEGDLCSLTVWYVVYHWYGQLKVDSVVKLPPGSTDMRGNKQLILLHYTLNIGFCNIIKCEYLPYNDETIIHIYYIYF